MGIYHGIIVSVSQKDRSIFGRLKSIGSKKVLLGLIRLYKVEVREEELDEVVSAIQRNMADRILFRRQEFYAHFYRDDELLIVFRQKVFRASTDRQSWGDALAYGRSLNISGKQLDFAPNRFCDETF